MVLLLGSGSLAHAAVVEPPPSVRQASPELRLLGDGKLRWFGLHVYDVALWSSASPFAFDHAFALALRYARDFKGSRIAARSVAEMQRLGYRNPDKLARWREAMERVFPDVQAGDRLTGVYRPGTGVEFFHQDRAAGTIPDPEFARAFFSIWLDPRTREPSLRAQLIGER
jgi:hypothetical protein